MFVVCILVRVLLSQLDFHCRDGSHVDDVVDVVGVPEVLDGADGLGSPTAIDCPLDDVGVLVSASIFFVETAL